MKKVLEDKLRYGRITRGISPDEELNIRDMINSCNERKHVRSLDIWRMDSATDPQRCNLRMRNHSAKELKRDLGHSI